MGEHTGKDGETVFLCDFCGKNQHEVERLVAGPVSHICDGCVAMAQELIAELRAKSQDLLEAHPS